LSNHAENQERKTPATCILILSDRGFGIFVSEQSNVYRAATQGDGDVAADSFTTPSLYKFNLDQDFLQEILALKCILQKIA
jgi:hypothetical protein